MIELIREEDFIELPDEASYKWVQLEKLARRRFLNHRENPTGIISASTLIDQYMNVVSELAATYEVKGISIPNGSSPEQKLDVFQLFVSRAQTRIWASGPPTFPLGRIALGVEAKKAILDLTAEIEAKIHNLDENDKRKKSYFARLEEFRSEINQPKTRIAAALTTLAQISTVVAMTTASFAQGPDAFAAIQMILGAEQLEAAGEELRLIESERQRILLPPPQKQIENKTETNTASPE